GRAAQVPGRRRADCRPNRARAGRRRGRRNVVSRFAENIVHFARLLRTAGLPLGTASVRDALEAAAAVDVTRKDELYWALHAVLVHRREEHDLYDFAFGLFFR